MRVKAGTPNLRQRALLVSVFIMIAVAACARPPDNRLNNWMTLRQIETAVRSALPPGTPLADIDRYFTANHVEHSYYKPDNQVFAMIDNIWGGFFPVGKGAQIVIWLDEAGKLARLEVMPVLTGP